MMMQGATLIGKITSAGTLVGKITMPVGYVNYAGSYETTPKVEKQTLPTKDKYMTDNVTIQAIPCFDVSNEAGGSTVYIGSEV